jgi:hypothetical protein
MSAATHPEEAVGGGVVAVAVVVVAVVVEVFPVVDGLPKCLQQVFLQFWLVHVKYTEPAAQ